MKASEVCIAWTPTRRGGPKAGKVRVDRIGGGWSNDYAYTDGAVFTHWRTEDQWALRAFVFIAFNTLVVRDGIDPQVAHDAFLNIDEYAERISPDIRGARE